MKNMKKFAALALAAAMTLSMAGCGADSNAAKDNKTATVITSKEDLKGAVIGVQTGTTGDIAASEDEVGAKEIKRFSKGSEAVLALKNGQVDAVIIDSQPAEKFVEKNDDLQILEEEFVEEEYAICIKKGNDDLRDKMNLAMEDLKLEGVMDQIMNSYLVEGKEDTRYVKDEEADRSNGKLIMATNAEFEPYEYHEGDKIVGIDADMAQALCDKMGYELEIMDMEFDAILMAVQSGKADFGAAGMTIREDRLENADFTNTYAKAKQVIIVKK